MGHVGEYRVEQRYPIPTWDEPSEIIRDDCIRSSCLAVSNDQMTEFEEVTASAALKYKP
jgi:hypothetical protein